MKFQNSIPLTLIGAAAAVSSSSNTSSEQGLISNGKVNFGNWADSYSKAVAFTRKLSTSEKYAIITAGSITNSTNANWTALIVSDGSQGAQEFFYESGFSQASALAMTWDKDAIVAQSKAVAKEFYGKGLQVMDAPSTQPLGRTPWNGRLGDGFGPDAYFGGILTGLTAKAYSDMGMIPNGKHFLLYEQETNRNTIPTGGSTAYKNSSDIPYSSNADDKTIHETYMWPWYDGIRNGIGAVMCSMNEVNRTYACESKDLLMKLLKTELGFLGMVNPDTKGQKTAAGSITGGLDYGSSAYWSTASLDQMLANGTLSEDRLDDMVIRNVIAWYQVGLDNGKQPQEAGYAEFRDTREEHAQIIRDNGAKSITLLKNKNGALPLSKPRLMSVFGANAGPVMGGPNMQFSFQGSGPTFLGHLGSGSGSSQASLPYLIDPHAALVYRAARDKTMLRWILNDTYVSPATTNTLTELTADETGATASYTAYAEYSDVCLCFINSLSGEGEDRTELYNDAQDDMVKSVASLCNNTIVVVTMTGVRLLDQWIEHENVTAVLYHAPLGQESGNSLIDVLYGDVNPSARLIHTIAKNESDYNVGICYTHNCNFTEGNYVDYKDFDHRNVTPRYEFGYGLSYTTFNYSDLVVNVSSLNMSTYASGPLLPGGRDDLWDVLATVNVTITNTGSVNGSEVPQLYLSYPSDSNADQPLRQLRGFDKVEIAVGASETVGFQLRRRDLSSWDVEAQEWALTKGTFGILVGASSRDFRMQGSLTV